MKTVQLFLEEGTELIKQRNKLLVISGKYGWETEVAYTLDPVAENSDDERRIKEARKEAKLLKEEKKKHQKSKRPSVQKAPFLGNRNPSFHPCLTILPKGSAIGVGDPGTTPGPAEPQFPHTGQALHQPHNNSLVFHEEFNFVLKREEHFSNLDNFVDLQNNVFSQNHNLSVFNDSYVENNHLEPELPPVKGRLAKNIKFWEGINASLRVLRIIKEGYALPFTDEPEPAEFKNNASARKHSDFCHFRS